MPTVPNNSVEQDLLTILESIESLFPKDELRPGVTTAFVDNGQTYAAVVRWPRRDVKLIAVSCKRPSLRAALADLKHRLARYIDSGAAEIPYIHTSDPNHAGPINVTNPNIRAQGPSGALPAPKP